MWRYENSKIYPSSLKFWGCSQPDSSSSHRIDYAPGTPQVDAYPAPSNPMSIQRGIALVMVLLYLLVISLLVASAFSSSLLQTKISAHIAQETQVFAYAESALLTGEQEININQTFGSRDIDANQQYQFQQIARPECGLFYQVKATGMMASTKVKLESIFMFPLGGKNPCLDVPADPRRITWRKQF